jgi:prepilin-type N-terminal cleavage/methylation domain-containing protein/prepilin-type processing-associated H-X9-DG protein
LGRGRAFTLIELLVVCAIIGLLALTLGPALARSTNSQTLQCMNNHRQLCAAWRMNADDNGGRILYSADDGTGAANPLNTNAWTWSHLNFSGNNPANWDTNYDIARRPLWPYMANDASLFKCPSDHSYVVVTNELKPRVRSVSMNFFLGGFVGNGSGSGTPGLTNYQLYLKIPQVSAPNKIFVFLDERPDTINWGSFITAMQGYTNVPGAYELVEDLPGFYHDQSCTFSFVDGHVEEKRWLDTRTTPAPSLSGILIGGKGSGNTFPVPYDPDVAWLQDHATRPK